MSSRRQFIRNAAVAGGAIGAAALAANRWLENVLVGPVRAGQAQIQPWLSAAEPGTIDAIDLLSGPLREAFAQRRQERSRQEPDFGHRIDAALNAGTINTVLFGYGEEHGETYGQVSGSITLVSYDYNHRQIRSVSLSRDIRAPELERILPYASPKWQVVRHAYRISGFSGMRTIVENATGFCVDYQVVLQDVVIRDFIDGVSGPVHMVLPERHVTGSFRLDGVDYPPDVIEAGDQWLSSYQAMRYILAEHLVMPGMEDERSYRKNHLLRALMEQTKQRVAADPYTLKLLADFGMRELREGKLVLEYPFHVEALMTGREQTLFNNFWDAVVRRRPVRLVFPESNEQKEIVIHDLLFGDGGVSRIHNIVDFPAARIQGDNPAVVAEARAGLLPYWMLIPDGGDPYATDLVDGYWAPVRKLVKDRLFAE